MRIAKLVAAVSVLAFATPGVAGGALSLVRAEDLPDDPAALQAWADVVAQEPYAASWSPEWKHKISREEVAKTLAASLATLRRVENGNGNTELLLAIGLTARYAHNVDVNGAPEAGIEALTRAASRSGTDPRPEWFLGTNLCLMGRPDALPHFGAAEARPSRGSLPADYWRDLLACASVSANPAHAVHAGRELERLNAGTALEADMVARAKDLLRDPDPAAEIPANEAWVVTPLGNGKRLASRPCGFAISLRPAWSAPPVRKGACATNGPVGSFPGKQGKVVPNVLVMSRVARRGESLEGFLSSFPTLAERAEVDGYPCPAASCRAFESRSPESYAAEGGGLAVAVVFEREEPEIRGLTIEVSRPPSPAADGKAHYFRPMPRYVRFPGKMFYLVLLDSAQSVAENAKTEYRRFLNELTVE